MLEKEIKMLKKIKDNEEFTSLIEDVINNETVLKMKNYRQHFNVSCYEHCYRVSLDCYKIAKKLKLDYKSIARAAMVHDLFLYDWRKKQEGRTGLHAFSHGKTACENALQEFDLSKKEQDMIIKHMWPVTLIPPKSLEGFILTIVDKYSTINEGINYLLKKKNI